jgi:hypothetical protein
MAIPFNKKQMCPRCERQIKVGGYLMLPGKKAIQHYCLSCAIAEVKDQAEREGKTVQDVLYLHDEVPEDDEQ